ncbi:unnamed protein product [Cylicocyclus nassatus]|uniref:ABC-2 type transporter transmembrane domain-containing protein n=1 Tax=Cylicocyclus nassatus TaxID=53992 RepID=A0AA36M4V9_CYLNA|nr:unnamed protein product [Cylicocyclus nassatus]
MLLLTAFCTVGFTALYPILFFTTLTIASEEESGVKEYLIVMGFRRELLSLSSVIFAFLKAFSVMILFGAVSFRNFLDMLPTVFPTLLLCISAAAMGLLCARVVKTTTAAMIGVKNIYDNLFVYDDVINVGTSFIYLFFASAVMILLAILMDFVMHTRNVPCCDRMLQHNESVPNDTRTYRESWHEKIASTAEPVLSVESVSKVWRNTGEIAVNNVTLKAYGEQVNCSIFSRLSWQRAF